ncbi:MAG: hypothetical protein K1X72_26625 [Pyrinomonadaceae bacterium]|nr:hypothetical protein [Pyrinomonadaceae bacterium]
MIKLIRFLTFILSFLLIQGLVVDAQQKNKNSVKDGILWKPINISQRDLLFGPGGKEMYPDLKNITFIKEVQGGYSKKFRIKDGSGREWVAKVGKEAQSETAAVRLVWALGYETEINYLIPSLTIPGKGTFQNVRLEARPDHIERKKNWKWTDNPFVHTNEFKGLKIMMAFLNNWDLKTTNNIILFNKDNNEYSYIVSDLGVTFGKLGSNPLPIFWRIGRSRNDPIHYQKSKLINGVKDERVKINYHGKSSQIFDNIDIDAARWLTNLLKQLSDNQIADAFHAANYSSQFRAILIQEVKDRIRELELASQKTKVQVKVKNGSFQTIPKSNF